MCTTIQRRPKSETQSAEGNGELPPSNPSLLTSQSRICRSRSLKNERGTTIVEFALILSLFVLIILGIMNFGRALWAYSAMAHVAREGARYAIVRGSESGRATTAAEIRNYVQGRAGPLGPVEVTTSWIPDNKPGSVVEVRVQYDFSSVLPLVPAGTIPLASTSRMVITF